ncbi:MAG: pilin [Patescibacteria group bacterium]
MPCVKPKLVAFALVVLTMLVPSVSFGAAATSCACYCGEVGVGAVPTGSMTAEKCQETCAENEVQYVGCFTDSNQYPYNSDRCWTKSECDAFSQEIRGEITGATWGTEMPYNCSRTKSSNEEMRHCYAEDVPYDLNISIGNVTKVENLPVYINAVYAWLLPAGALVAVVMMMIGGIQYVMSRGKEKYISKGKDRITNAITGLVLLLSVFVILNLIDPRLTSLNALKVPLIKEVVILDANSSCERLSSYGYTIETAPSSTAQCGGTGTIKDDANLKTNALGTWKIGDSCDYVYCASNKTCVAEGETHSCKSCFEIPTPTASTCSAVEAFDTGTYNDTQIYCEFNSTLNSCTTAGNNLGTTGSSSQGFYCGALRTYAAQTVDGGTTKKGCDVYNDLNFGYAGSVGDIGTLEGSLLLKRLCNEDLCDIAKTVGANRCNYNEGTTVTDYLFGFYSSATDTYACHTF